MSDIVLQPKLREWAREKLGHLPRRQTAKKMGVSTSRLSDLLGRDDKKIGPIVCEAIAHFTRTPVHIVFEMAELLPRTPEDSSATRYLKYIYGQLDENGKKDLISFAEHLRDRHRQSLP